MMPAKNSAPQKTEEEMQGHSTNKEIILGALQSQAIFEQLVDAIVIYDLEGNATYINKAFENIFGWSRKELLGKRIDFVPDENHAETIEAARRLYREGKVPLLETRRFTKEKQILDIHISASRLDEGEGKPVGMLVILRDVTDIKQKEEELNKYRENLEKLVKEQTKELQMANKEVSWSYHTQSVISDLLNIAVENLPLERQLERAIEILMGAAEFIAIESKAGIFLVGDEDKLVLTASRGLPPETQTLCSIVPFGHCLCGRAAETCQLQFADHVDHRHDNKPENLAAHGHYNVPILSEGKLRGVLVLYLAEGHHQNDAEIEFLKIIANTLASMIDRKYVDREIQESQALYQTIFNSSPVMFWVKDTNNTTLQINQAAADLEGIDPESVAGKSAYDMYPREQAEAFFQDDLAVINSGKPKLGIVEQHTAVGTGDDRWLETGKVPIRNTKDEIVGVMAFAIDITKSKQAEEAIRESYKKRGEQVVITSQVAQEIATAKNINAIFETVVTLVKERFGYYHTQIFRHNPNTDSMQLVVGYGKTGDDMRKAGHKLVMGQGIVGTAASTGNPQLASDVTQDREWRPNLYLPDTKGELAVPIKFQGEILGILDVQSDHAGTLTQDDVLLLENLAGQIAIAIENARLRDEMGIRIEEIESLYRSTSKTVSTNLKNDQISLAFLPEKETVEESIEQWVEEVERVITQKSTFTKKADEGEDIPLAVSPINIRGEVIGALGIQPDELRELSQEDLEMLEAVASQVAQALESARLFQQTQDSEEHLRALIDNAPEAILVIDTQTGKFLDPNENAVKLYGFPADELIKIGPVETSPEFQPDGRLSSEASVEYLEQALQGATTVFEWTHKNAHGDLIPCEIRLARLPGIQNQIRATVTDITERKMAQEELAKFKLGIEQTDSAVFITDIEGVIQYVNPGFERIYGYMFEEAVGKTPRILKSGLTSREEYTQFWDTMLNKGTVSGEIINKTKSGQLVPIARTNSPILDEKGEILGFLSVNTDITERKRNEEALQRRNEYLAASAEIGRLVTSTLDLNSIFTRTVNLIVERFGFYHAGVFIIDESGFNAVLQEATGAAGIVMKERGHMLAVGSNSTVGRATDSREVVIINNTALDLLHKLNPLLPETRSEAAIPLQIGSRIIGALDIQSTEVNAFSQDDIAILQLLADQVAVGIDNARSYNIAQQAVEEMREVDRLKSQFLANMSHELRTPLNSIIGFARVILKGIDGPITELQQQDLTAIFNSGQHLLGLINDILDLSRIEAGKMELTFDEVNMTELISSVLSTAVGLIKDKPIELKREVAADLPTVRADAMRIRQVLINFMSNAAKFTEEGHILVKASVEEVKKGQPMVLVSVTDTGPGIAQEDQSKLFQAFSQVDASLTRKVGGTGLGLSICQHFIHMHGGQIGVHSAVGEGSTFYFSVPLYGKPDANGADSERVILAIDDDPQIINLYERYLQPKGFTVIGLNDPAKARERVGELKPFAITLDIMMPGYDGWQVLTDLKSHPETREIPVIVCSIIEDEEKGFSLGAADYLIKPIMEDDLLSSLDRLNGDGSIREVLVIDDDPNDLRLLGKMISEQGKYKAILAEGGPAGWNTIIAKAPHAIILDLFMPEMDGFTILEQLRRDEKLRSLPVIVITGADLTVEQQKQLENLGQRLLQKSSLRENELIATIEGVLRRVKAN